MVFTSPESPKRHANAFLEGVSAVMALLARRANRLKQKMKTPASDADWAIELRSSPKKSPLAKPKKLLSSISNKALPFGHNKKKLKGGDHGVESSEEEWGDGGVWQKAILMGDKCQPLDFSGVIYYDSNGKQMNEIPLRSPRASPLPGYLNLHREHRP
ncbi:uncharacterized protein LOC129320766 [Prosopis cineraria]|uniref:uncharacterized protein LOC129320766 n=1 Tax=Prosopis cineraria TaxID=364024 RepID=UPI00240EC664|nr:uncharacterized protein LOC129320766 [Prosopis cineraria]